MCITYGLIMSINGYKKEILKRAIPCDSISTLFSATSWEIPQTEAQ